MGVKIGINPLTWLNNAMREFGAETSLDVCLAEGKLARYAGYELGHKFPRDPVKPAAIFAKYDLEVVAGKQTN